MMFGKGNSARLISGSVAACVAALAGGICAGQLAAAGQPQQAAQIGEAGSVSVEVEYRPAPIAVNQQAFSRAIPPQVASAIIQASADRPTENCVVIGDSLALGTGGALNGLGGGISCRVIAKKGISSTAILGNTPMRVSANLVVLSAGANDAANPRLEQNLAAIRSRVAAHKVIWLSPRDRRAASAVDGVCSRWGDTAVDLAAYPSNDNLHPRSYLAVARAALISSGCA